MLKRTLLLLLSLATLGGAAYLSLDWRRGARESSIPLDPRRGGEDAIDDSELFEQASANAAARLEVRASGADRPRVAPTTWGARVETRDGRRPLSGVALRISLLSPDSPRQEMRLISGADGEAGPLEIDAARFLAAEVSIEPGPEWAGLVTTVSFAAGRANHDVFEVSTAATLSVRVLDLVRNAPLPGAEVAVHDANGVVATGTSDARGVARLPWRAVGGPFAVRAHAAGYSAVSWAELMHPPSADLQLELLVAPAGDLRIRVQDQHGRPLARCEVALSVQSEALPRAESPEVRTATAEWAPPTESNGAYSFAALPCETPFAVRIRTEDGLEGGAPAWIRASTAFAEIAVTIARSEGTVVWTVEERGAPLARVALGMEKANLGATDEIGRTVLALQESKRGQELWAFRSGYAFAWQEWAPEKRDMIYSLTREGSVSGKVVDSKGRPQRLVRITPLLGERAEARDVRQRRGEALLEKSGGRATGTDSSGAFALKGIGDLWVDLHVRPPKGSAFVIQDVLVGTSDLVVTLPDEEKLGKERGIALALVVLDKASGRRVPGASVTAFHAPEGNTESLKGGRSAKTKSDGTARLTFAESGQYVVMVSADGYVPHSSAVAHYPVGEHTLEVELAPACELEVVLVDANGVGQASYWISAVSGEGETVPFEHVERGAQSSRSAILTDVKGRARANRMPSGRLTLEVRVERDRSGHLLVQQPIELVPGERTEVELRLP